MLLTVNAMGQEDTTRVLKESVVTADRLQDKVIPAQTLAGESLKALGSVSIADALRYFSGVQIKDYGGIGGLKTINVRSLGTEQTGVFYDGVQIGSAQNGQVDLGRFSLDNLESVTLYNGQKSSSVQSAKDYASASSVYLQSKAPEFIKGRRTNIRLGLSGGSFGTINPTLLWEQKLSDRISSTFDASYLYTTGKYKFTYAKQDGYDTTAVRQNGDVSALRLEESLYGSVPDGLWRAKAYYYKSVRGYPGAFVREVPGMFVHQDRQWDDDVFVQGSYERQLGRLRLSTRGKFSFDRLHYLADPRLDVTTMYVDNTYLQSESYLSASGEYNIASWVDASLAVDWQRNRLRADLTDFVDPVRNALYGAAAVTVHWHGLRVQGSVLETAIHDATTDGTSWRQALTPTIVASWLVYNDLTIRGFCKKIFRMPTFNDLYYTFIGNASLEPETSRQHDLGLTWKHTWHMGWFWAAEVSADGYYNIVDNKIMAVPASNQFRWTMANIGHVNIAGTDVNATALVSAGPVNIRTRATYTYQDARDTTDPTSQWYGGQIPYIPWHSGSLAGGVSWGGFTLDWSWIYTGRRYSSSANIPTNLCQPWYTTDMSLTWTTDDLVKLARLLRITLSINNLFNQQYEVVRCYPMPGTNFRLSVILDI